MDDKDFAIAKLHTAENILLGFLAHKDGNPSLEEIIRVLGEIYAAVDKLTSK